MTSSLATYFWEDIGARVPVLGRVELLRKSRFYILPSAKQIQMLDPRLLDIPLAAVAAHLATCLSMHERVFIMYDPVRLGRRCVCGVECI